MPLDAQPSEDGNITIHREGGNLVARYLSKEQRAEHAGHALYKSHFATCPHAESWRPKGISRTEP